MKGSIHIKIVLKPKNFPGQSIFEFVHIFQWQAHRGVLEDLVGGGEEAETQFGDQGNFIRVPVNLSDPISKIK